MLPTDANAQGDVHGGAIMKLADTAGALAAMRHARSRVVTVVMDSMTFQEPVHVGDLVHVSAGLTWTGRTSMEVIVSVEAEDVVRGTRRRTSDAFLVYVALDEQGHPRPVPPLLVETPEQRALGQAAEVRRQARLRARG
ncbi:MAG TPA: acyl-CoA thioesterase [Chloroflexota bacterium]|jgi:acyl-CoA hydrolase|nr:acyl-CoA thioesterase [Chloroflexota bacterium]